MKATILILLLVLSTLVIGCTTQTSETIKGESTTPSEVTEKEAINQIDTDIIPEDSDVEIGEMI